MTQNSGLHLLDDASAIAAAVDAVRHAATSSLGRVGSGEYDGLAVLETLDEVRAALVDATDQLDLLGNVHPVSAVRDAAVDGEQVLRAILTDITLDRAVYDQLTPLADLELDADTRHYVSTLLAQARLAGVDRDAETRARVRDLRNELVGLEQTFSINLANDVRRTTFPATSLSALPADWLVAHPADAEGRVTVSTSYPDTNPLLAYCDDRAVREEMWRLFWSRGNPDNEPVLRRILSLRYELAQLLGHQSWADFITTDKMIGSAAGVERFLTEMEAALEERRALDLAALVELHGGRPLRPWDSAYLADQLKNKVLDFDTNSARVYFEFDRVTGAVMAFLAHLFDVTFTAVPGATTWHEDVTCWEVGGSDGPIGRIFLDMHPREGKFGHAAAFAITTGKAGVRSPECALVMNFPQGSQADPSLLSLSEVSTFLHEFGHAMHVIFAGGSRWSGLNGLTREWDFVEAPSQLLEEWMGDPEVVNTFARHYRTGESMPAEMLNKLCAAQLLNRGITGAAQLTYAALSFRLHREDPADLDLAEVERSAFAAHSPVAPVAGIAMRLAFGHLTGYSAMYYTYLWSLVIAKDLFTAFAAGDQETVAAHYRASVLGRGSAAPASQLIKDFLGRGYTFDAYRDWLSASADGVG